MYTVKTNIRYFYNNELENLKDITSLLFHLAKGKIKHITTTSNEFITIYKDGVLQEQYTTEEIINDVNTLISFKKPIIDMGMVVQSNKIAKKFNYFEYCLIYAELSKIDKRFYKPLVVENIFDNLTLKKSTSLVFPLFFVKDKKTLSKIKLIQTIQPVLELNLNDYKLKIIE